MKPSVLVPIADGSEEIEASVIINVLRRAGAQVTIASAKSVLEVTGARGIKIVADKLLGDCLHEQYDLIALPGGMPGAEHLRDNAELIMILKRQVKEGRFYAAICASPAVVLAHHGFLDGKRATAYPGFQSILPVSTEANLPVVVDGNCVTGQSPGTAFEFALMLIKILFDEEKAREIRRDLVFI